MGTGTMSDRPEWVTLPTSAGDGNYDSLYLHMTRQSEECIFLKGSFEGLADDGAHREEAECLRERHTIRAHLQKLDLGFDFPKRRPRHKRSRR